MKTVQNLTKKHQGEIVKNVIFKIGIPISVVAKRMRISRSTLYNRFLQEDIEDLFLQKLGEVLKYDFAVDFPECKKLPKRRNKDALGTYISECKKIQKSYIKLLEAHKKTLALLLQLIHEKHKLSPELAFLIKKILALEKKI